VATEYEDLDQLARSQGWLRLQQYVTKEWGDRFQDLIKVAVSDRDDAFAVRRLQQVLVAKEAVEKLMQWPSERLAQLEQAKQIREAAEHTPLSRRGTL
jgi:hypothetical protein